LIGEPNASLPRHIAGTDQPLSFDTLMSTGRLVSTSSVIVEAAPRNRGSLYKIAHSGRRRTEKGAPRSTRSDDGGNGGPAPAERSLQVSEHRRTLRALIAVTEARNARGALTCAAVSSRGPTRVEVSVLLGLWLTKAQTMSWSPRSGWQ
jgi:hypothetical protein